VCSKAFPTATASGLSAPGTERRHESIWTHLSHVPFRQDWILVDGIRTRYVQAGDRDAPALIMLHGPGGTWEAFCAAIGPHSKHFNCFAMDLLGCGFTDKPDKDYQIADYVEHVRGFMSAQGLARTSIMGISMGSWIAARFALTYPDRTQKLILNAPFGLSDDEAEIRGIIRRRAAAYDDPSWENIKAIFNNLIYSESKRIDDLIALRQATYLLPDAKAASDHILSVFTPKYLPANLIHSDEWKRITAPTLVIASLKDRPLYLNTARKVAKLVPKARLFEMDGVGHWPPFEDPEVFNTASVSLSSSNLKNPLSHSERISDQGRMNGSGKTNRLRDP
jgi:2-hydroxy-6-oxonona-2,4-dienedioate hydrolase